MEYTKYRCGKPSKRSNWTNPDCVPVTCVYHTAHIADSFRIVEDGYIRSSLVWDESKLRNTRTCVAWVSPNSWQRSLYGNVRFSFDWGRLVRGKRLYWVEAMVQYQPTAYRILVTSSRHSGDGLQEYDHTSNNGPLYFDGLDQIWYCNGELNGELMIELDLPLDDCIKIDFVAHHASICNKFSPKKNRGRCPDLDLSRDRATSCFLSTLLGRGLTRVNQLLMDPSKPNDFSFETWNGLLDLFNRLTRKMGTTDETIPKSKYLLLLRAALHCFSIGNVEECTKILELFGSPKCVLKAAETLIEEHFGVQVKGNEEWRELY